MKVLGLDPASKLSANALVEHPPDGNPRLLSTDIWTPNERKSPAWNLFHYFLTVQDWVDETEPDMACVESLKVTRNAQTARVISHYQAASVLGCKVKGLMVVEAGVSSARREALNDGSLSKDNAWPLVKAMFPDHQFRAKNSGGTDEADATVLGVAGPGLAEL